MQTEAVKLTQISVNKHNPRTITDDKFQKLVNSILVLPKMLELRPIVVDGTMTALGGNMRHRALTAISQMKEADIFKRLSEQMDFKKKTKAEQDALLAYWAKWIDAPTVPIVKASNLSVAEKKEFIIKDNVGYGDWDMDILANEWDNNDLVDWGLDVWQTLDESSETESSRRQNEGSLQETFIVPPFSVLDTRRGYWQKRKKLWRDKIGDLGATRSKILFQSPEMQYADIYSKSQAKRANLGISFREYLDKYVSDEEKASADKGVLSQGVSLFDPVLSEIMCKWFTPKSGAYIFDPMAGDANKGLVFGLCGYKFTGIELRKDQVDVNNDVISKFDLPIKYICDDGLNVEKYFEKESQDMLFSCPPYFDLEVYSDLPNDASNQSSYTDFIALLRSIYSKAYTRLKNNRFAILVVGDVRNKSNGAYYDFVGDIRAIFRDLGAHYYNEIILVENAATASLRCSKYMLNRKVAKVHQNILVFYKGDPKAITSEFADLRLNEDEEKFLQDIISEDDSDEIKGEF